MLGWIKYLWGYLRMGLEIMAVLRSRGIAPIIVIVAVWIATAIAVLFFGLPSYTFDISNDRVAVIDKAGEVSVQGKLLVISLRNYGDEVTYVESIYLNDRYPVKILYAMNSKEEPRIAFSARPMVKIGPGEIVYVYGYTPNLDLALGTDYKITIRTSRGAVYHIVTRALSKLDKLYLPIYVVCIKDSELPRAIGTSPSSIGGIAIKHMYTIETYQDLYLFIYKPREFEKRHPGYPIENTIVVNCHGEVIPYAGPYDPSTDSNWWKKYLDDLRVVLAKRKIVFVSIARYSFWRIKGIVIGKDIRVDTIVGHRGLLHILNLDRNAVITKYVGYAIFNSTRAIDELSKALGIGLPTSIAVDKALRVDVKLIDTSYGFYEGVHEGEELYALMALGIDSGGYRARGSGWIVVSTIDSRELQLSLPLAVALYIYVDEILS